MVSKAVLSCALVLVSIYWFTAEAHQTKKCYFGQPANGALCGDRLTKALMIMCNRRFSSGSREKRAIDNAGHNRTNVVQSLDDERKLMTKRNALSFLDIPGQAEMSDTERLQRGSSRLEPGVACECCIYKCAVKELCHYCAARYECEKKASKYSIAYLYTYM